MNILNVPDDDTIFLLKNINCEKSSSSGLMGWDI